MCSKCIFLHGVIFLIMSSFSSFWGLPLDKTSTRNHIIFPPEPEIIIELVPKCPNNRTFCEEVDYYPKQKFHQILKNTTYEEEYFKPQSIATDKPISDRFHTVIEFYICRSETKTQFPRVARNVRNEWKFVYNFDEYKQGVKTEECTNETACTSFEGTPREVKTKCIQKYSDNLLLVADEQGNPVWDLFWFPSACLCSYEPIINFNYI